MSETKCECHLQGDLADHSLAVENFRKVIAREYPDSTRSDNPYYEIRSHMAAVLRTLGLVNRNPCPCDGLREEVGRLTERAQEAMAYGRKNFDAALGFQDRALRAEAERDQLRAALVRKINDYSSLWAECDGLREKVEKQRQALARLSAPGIERAPWFYAPCPNCGAIEGTGLQTTRIDGVLLPGHTSVWCSHCEHFGPGVSRQDSVQDTDRAAVIAWNAEFNSAWAERDQLRAELAEARLDAARLDWRESHQKHGFGLYADGSWADGIGGCHPTYRAAIDAAMAVVKP